MAREDSGLRSGLGSYILTLAVSGRSWIETVKVRGSPTNVRKLLDMLARRVRCMQTVLNRKHEVHVKSTPQPLSMSYELCVFVCVLVYCVYCV